MEVAGVFFLIIILRENVCFLGDAVIVSFLWKPV